MHRIARMPVLFLCLSFALTACREDDPERPDGWSYATHSNDAAANYERVFPDDEVLKLEIRIAQADWDAMMADMQDMLGDFGVDQGGPVVPPSNLPPPGGGGPIQLPPGAFEACVGRVEGDACAFPGPDDQMIEGVCVAPPVDGGLLCGPAGDTIIGGNPITRTPVWKPVDIFFEGRPWRRVGMRLKGNSTLTSSWHRGTYKLPFRLSFDHFEEDFPEIRNQRFHGFQRLSFTNNESDASFLREKLTSDLLEAANIVAPRSTFVRVYIDRGAGAEYFGLYTMTEIPDEPLLERHFGSSAGNLYKPEEGAADWRRFAQENFEKQNNEADGDWSDVQAAIAALNADRTDAAAWRAELERTFDVGSFLEWLAANAALANWDTYGAIPHNYYLYGVPSAGGRLHWIPWDHDLSFSTGDFPVMYERTQAHWPLIYLLLRDPLYREQYVDALRAFASGPFAENAVASRMNAAHTLIAPYVVGPDGERPSYTSLRDPNQFSASLDAPNGLLAILRERHVRIEAALAQEP